MRYAFLIFVVFSLLLLSSVSLSLVLPLSCNKSTIPAVPTELYPQKYEYTNGSKPTTVTRLERTPEQKVLKKKMRFDTPSSLESGIAVIVLHVLPYFSLIKCLW